ncbi:MAG: hypothetical protein Q7W13_16455 [Bacteroidia bacterium]|nr:hypothetical protein [Bacteroidia bacterium]
MTRDINDFMTFARQKNGRIKITQKEGNIYKLLHELGYSKTKLKNKRIYFHRDKMGLTLVSLSSIKDAFKNMLKTKSFINIPANIDSSDILEWYYMKNRIKENGLFDHYLADTLTEDETHKLRLQTDPIYEAQHLLSKFDKWGFSKSVDIAGGFSKNKVPYPLYYKNIGDKKFLVFSYSKFNKNKIDVFDCWIATFENEKHIGNKKSLDMQKIKFSFKLENDFDLISKYVC